ncbi:hypothetical protein VNO80_20139 [Phaseolus coccineus]|uniref:Uncharacterized protein n=1 Tax=Phaseolus coccineus TaxID=3886 RepID=A0AAN9MM82_PHACN
MECTFWSKIIMSQLCFLVFDVFSECDSQSQERKKLDSGNGSGDSIMDWLIVVLIEGGSLLFNTQLIFQRTSNRIIRVEDFLLVSLSSDLGKSVIAVFSSLPKALTQVAPSSFSLKLICLHFSLQSYFPYQALDAISNPETKSLKIVHTKRFLVISCALFFPYCLSPAFVALCYMTDSPWLWN